MSTCICNPMWAKWVSPVERLIIGHTIKTILENPRYRISVYDGEEVALFSSIDAEQIIPEVAATDQTWLNIHDQEGVMVGWIRFIHGNDRDVLSDHSANPETGSIVGAVEKLMESFE